jgi:hypothetical protein
MGGASPFISLLGRKVKEIALVLQPPASRDAFWQIHGYRQAFYFLRERDPLPVFCFGAHFTARDNNEKRITEDRSVSAF